MTSRNPMMSSGFDLTSNSYRQLAQCVSDHQPDCIQSICLNSQHSNNVKQSEIIVATRTSINMSCNNSFSSVHEDDLQISEGSFLGKSYQVEALLGQGGFGVVAKCHNTETNKVVAIKVNKNHLETTRQAKQEIEILRRLQFLDPDTCNIVRWNGYFLHKDRFCLNFELLDQSLYNYMEDRNFHGLPLTELRSILQQVATALCYLRTMGTVHADIKPENIMVVDRRQQPLKVKLIDFGLACPVFAVVPGVCVQTICYRAPEVMLHIPFNEAIDMWSLGVVAAELATGYPLYPGWMDYDVLSFIIETQGQPADYVLDRGMGTHYYFHQQSDSQQRWIFKTPEEFHYETGFCHEDTREVRLRSLDDLEQLMYRGYQCDKELSVDLIKGMLQLDPDQRLLPQEVLQHPFINNCLPQSSRADTCVEMTNAEEVKPEVSQQPSCCLTTGPENVLCSMDKTATSLAVEMEEVIPEEMDVQPQKDAKNDGWLKHVYRGIAFAFNFYCNYVHA